ncbi:MAG: phosphopantetheine-binding protein [Polyangiaceae bacterium]
MVDSVHVLVAQRRAILERLETILLDDLQVPREPGTLDPDTPLFGAGLALDSMDAMELVIATEESFGVRLPSADQLHIWMRTLNKLADLVLVKRALVQAQRPEVA